MKNPRYLSLVVTPLVRAAVRRHARRQGRASVEIVRDALAIHLAALDTTIGVGTPCQVICRAPDGREYNIGTVL